MPPRRSSKRSPASSLRAGNGSARWCNPAEAGHHSRFSLPVVSAFRRIDKRLAILLRCFVGPPPFLLSSSSPSSVRAESFVVAGSVSRQCRQADRRREADQFAWDRLAELTDTYGQRLSGSENLNRAIAWAVETMKKDGLENVHTERVMIPKWVRGSESLEITNPPHHVVPMLGLGGSVATPPAGIEAEVMVVSSGDDLAKRAARGQGQDRPLQRAVHQLRRDGGVSIRRRLDGGAAWRGGHAGARGRADRPAHAAHRRHERTPPTSRRFPPPRSRWKTRMRIQRLVNRGVTVRVRLKMEARVRSRRRILQRRRRDPRQREARGDRARRRSLRFLGPGHGRVGRCGRLHRDVGSGAADEEAEHPAEAHGARGAVHQRRERPARRQRLSRCARRRSGESRVRARVRLRRVRAGAPRLHRIRCREKDGGGDRHAAVAARHAGRRSAAAAAPTSARSPRSARCR